MNTAASAAAAAVENKVYIIANIRILVYEVVYTISPPTYFWMLFVVFDDCVLSFMLALSLSLSVSIRVYSYSCSIHVVCYGCRHSSACM